jgi:hypothetical protein
MSVIGLLATGAVQAPTPSCAETVLNDWYDGALDSIYDPECYQEALQRLPEDVRVYTTAVDDISRAMRQQLAAEGEASTSKGSARSLSGVRKAQSREKTRARVAVGQVTEARRPPLPLLLLGTVVLVLAAATAGTVVTRRVRRRPSS